MNKDKYYIKWTCDLDNMEIFDNEGNYQRTTEPYRLTSFKTRKEAKQWLKNQLEIQSETGYTTINIKQYLTEKEILK